MTLTEAHLEENIAILGKIMTCSLTLMSKTMRSLSACLSIGLRLSAFRSLPVDIEGELIAERKIKD